MFILEENNLNLTQRYLGWALAGFFLDFCVFFFSGFWVDFLLLVAYRKSQKNNGKGRNADIARHAIYCAWWRKKKREGAGWGFGKDLVGDRYILKAKIVSPKKWEIFAFLMTPKWTTRKKKKNSHTYCWFKKSCTTWDVKNPVNNGRNPAPVDIVHIPLFTEVLLTSQLVGLGISSTNRRVVDESMCGHPAWWWSIY